MYKAFFGFRTDPFASKPDPAFFFRSSHHDAALKGLLLSVEARMGLISLVGEEGSGKTVVLECLRNSLGPDIPCVFLRDSRISFARFLAILASDLNLDLRFNTKSAPQVFLALTRLVTQQARSGRTVVLIVDEAHNLPAIVFDEIVHTASLYHDNVKAIQTVFAGRPEFQPRLAALNPGEVGQRAILSRSLYPFTAQETQEYIEFRMARAGMPKQTIFPRKALEAIHDDSQGHPPAIHALCERLLLTAFSARSKVCTREICDQVFKKRHTKLAQIVEDARTVVAARIDHLRLASPPAPEPPPMQNVFLRVAVDARPGSLRSRPVSTDERPVHLEAITFKMVFPRWRPTLAGAELPLSSTRPMPIGDCTKASALRPSLDPGPAISSIPVRELSPRFPESAAGEARKPGAPQLSACKLIPSEGYGRIGAKLTGVPPLTGSFPETFSRVLQPRYPATSLQPASIIPCSRVPLTLFHASHAPLPPSAGRFVAR